MSLIRFVLNLKSMIPFTYLKRRHSGEGHLGHLRKAVRSKTNCNLHFLFTCIFPCLALENVYVLTLNSDCSILCFGLLWFVGYSLGRPLKMQVKCDLFHIFSVIKLFYREQRAH